jgi:hypothetical protein
MELRFLTDDELFARIESLDDAGGSHEAVQAGLEELFRRLREQAAPEDLLNVERVIRFVRSAFADDDEDDGSAGAGVREPRRPAPQSGSASAARRVSDAA